MEKRIQLELRGRPPKEVAMLSLDNCRSPQIAGLTDEFVNLEVLSMIQAGLTSLKGFPSLPHLKRLDVSDNQLTGGLENLSGCPSITHLNFSGNCIKDIEALRPLKDLKELKSLDLFNCDVANVEGFREKIFEMIPHLKYLDGFDKECAEAEESDDEYADEEEQNGEDEDSEDEDEEEEEEGEDDDGDEEAEEDEDEDGSEGEDKNESRGKKRKLEEEEGD